MHGQNGNRCAFLSIVISGTIQFSDCQMQPINRLQTVGINGCRNAKDGRDGSCGRSDGGNRPVIGQKGQNITFAFANLQPASVGNKINRNHRKRKIKRT